MRRRRRLRNSSRASPSAGDCICMHSPPCQLLSSMNTSGEKLANVIEGIRQVHWSIDLFERLKARFLTTENVPRMHKYFKCAGYRSKVIVASECSATAQDRKRANITNFKFKPRAPRSTSRPPQSFPTSTPTKSGSSTTTAMSSR
jgi:site-specific DNA-cytosine methylase